MVYQEGDVVEAAQKQALSIIPSPGTSGSLVLMVTLPAFSL